MPTKYTSSRLTTSPANIRDSLSVAKEDEAEASSRRASRYAFCASPFRSIKWNVRFLESR